MINKVISSVDLEGNGRNPPDIVEIGITHIVDYEIKWCRSWLVRPMDSITSMATSIHGIKTDDVINMPMFEEIEKEIFSLVKDSYLLAHNVSVERNLLSRKLPNWKPEGLIDTLKLSRDILPGIQSYSLSSLVKYLKLDSTLRERAETGPHRAKYDSLATAYLYCELSSIARHMNIDIENIISNGDDLNERQLNLF